ncbi:Rpn family recombination-promoting nuclease/putative transposase [Caldisalinibacter kiritimatiensis]|uniref:Rpn family recombination-promoting nuclease/putative transposase n=1 Tax=Caldisalinibacter kiritimatiensis TaxID=1304284 RepID=R1CM34_9FIRM|nr:Rpn family recombination-promoting nuclease/putative transposase [Caldisalinibacter kiritimatiensis]EOC99770.1 hypothetical protein L21TH_2200 [Caldisalinibacter kiritimatiensis]
MVKKKDEFIMSPKIDFVFKLLFGNEKNKELLISFLSAVLKMPKEKFSDIKIINSELLREFKEDKKGILDVRVQTPEGEQIDIEIQILPTEYMPERTLFYWSKMYTSSIKPGDTYDKLKKCITINIVDFKFIPIKKIHTVYHIKEDETNYELTDILEIHFLELPKLFDDEIPKDENEEIIQWMEFIDGKSRGVMEMLARKNKDIKKAYDLLEAISKDEKARMAYEAREAEIRDQLTRIKSAEDKGREEGIKEGKYEVVKNLIKMGLDLKMIADGAGISYDEVVKIKEEIEKEKH